MKIDYPIRLQSFLAKSGFGSRRGCEELILQGRVTINGRRVRALGTKVEMEDVVYVDDELAEPADKSYYLVLNKPTGFVCTNYDPFETSYARDLINIPQKNLLYNVGRLDKDSSGLILFTNDGDFANKVMHPSNEIEKEYLVKVDRFITKKDLECLKKGEIKPYHIVDYKKETKTWVRITLFEGKNREIRKMLEALNFEVEKLIRVRIGKIKIDKLASGRYRSLTKPEIDSLLKGENK